MIKSLALTIVALIFFGLTKLVFNTVVIRSYGPDILGNINLAISTAFLFSLISSAGLGPTTTKYIAHYIGRGERDISKYVYTIALLLTVTLSAVMCLLMFAYSRQLARAMNGEASWFIRAAPIVFSYSLYTLFKCTYYGTERVGNYFKNEIFADGIFFFALFVFVLFGLTSFLVTPFVLLYSVFALWAIYAQRSLISFSLLTDRTVLKRIVKEMLSFFSVCFAGTSADMAGLYIGTILTGAYGTSAEAGYYSAALSVSMPFHLMSRSTALVVFPSMANYYGKKDFESIGRLLNMSTKWLIITSSFLCGLAVIFARLIFNIVAGIDHLPGVLTLRILLVTVYIAINGVPAVNSLSGTKYVHIPAIASIIGLILACISWILLIPVLGIVGTALGFLILTATGVSVSVYYAQKYFDGDLLASIRIALIVGGLVVTSGLLGEILFVSPLYSQIVGGILFIVTFIAIHWRDLSMIGNILRKKMHSDHMEIRKHCS
jgi:O-antigen/teichoic acid export membrane protein